MFELTQNFGEFGCRFVSRDLVVLQHAEPHQLGRIPQCAFEVILHDFAVEIDCYPDRQDLSIDLLAIAKKEGCRISLGTDSHGASQLRFMDLGIAATIRAKVDPERLLNLMSTDKLLQWATGVREPSC